MTSPGNPAPKVVAERLDIRQNALAQYMTLAGYSAQDVGTALNELVKLCGQATYARESDKGPVYAATDVLCGGKPISRIAFTISRNQIVHVGGVNQHSASPQAITSQG